MLRLRPSLHRFWTVVLGMSLATLGLVVVAGAPAAAAPLTTRAFTPVYTANVTGDVIVRGNTLETCKAGTTQAQTGGLTCAAAQTGGSQQNNNYFMDYVDADGTTGNTTFDSSSATVTVPAGATVLYAGLSWGATTGAGSLTGYSALTGVAAPNASLRNKAKLKVPGASDYTTVTSTTDDLNGPSYQSFVDVTAAVKAAGSGSYTVADVQAGTGGGNYAGWSLAVAFSDVTLPARNLVIFTGYNQVSTTNASVDIPVSGFTTPAVGAVTTKVGVVAYEGDKGSAGDGMSIGGTSLYNTLNPVLDVFNSTVTDLNVAVTDRTPSYANLLGFDIDRLDATGALANGSTSTVVHLTTNAETYYPGMLTFATDLYSSALTATKTVTDVNGGTVSRSDRLNYSVVVRNGGGDGASLTTLTDVVPAGTSYVAGSLTVGGVAVTDAAGDDTGDVTSGNVSARLGVGATGTTGGVLAPQATATVTFGVTVFSTAADGFAVVNTATFTNRDVTTGVGYSGGSNTLTSSVVVPPTLSGTLTGATLTAPYSSGLTVSNGTGPFVWSVTGGALPAGLTLSTSTGLITGTPTSAGSTSVTVSVVDANNRSASRTQSIVVAAAPAVAFTPPTGEVGVAYNAQPTATGGTGPLTWVVSAGTLPAGLSIDPTTGAITGTPTASGTPSITVQATDANGVTATSTATLTVVAAPTLTFPSSLSSQARSAYSRTLSSSGGLGPFVWSVSAGALPAGLSLDRDTGVLSGTPTTPGSSTFTVRIVDRNGAVDTRATTMSVTAGASTVSLSAPGSVRFGTAVTLTAAVGPSTPTGTVTFTDVPTAGPQAGTTVTLGTGTVSGGSATLSTPLPAFGVNTVKASYGGDDTHAAAASTTVAVEVSAYAGQVIVSEFRTAGPGGAGDNYVELLNTGPAVPLAGMAVSSDSGTVTTLPPNAGILGTGRSYLVTGAGFTLASIATSDDAVATVGVGGMRLTAPDTAGTTMDAAGPATGFHTGTGLAAITGNPDSQWAWVRTEVSGKAADSRNNAADFQLVSTGFAPVGGAQPTLGSPSPTGTADPYQHNSTVISSLLDPGVGAASAPNRGYVSGTPGRLVLRRTLTNTGGETITAAKVRVSALSERFGAPRAGGGQQPARVAQLRVVDPAAATEQITVSSGSTVTVRDLGPDAPSTGPGGGLNSTLTVPLPGGGLAPGASVDVALSFDVDTRGTFWLAYDVDASTTSTSALCRGGTACARQKPGAPVAGRAAAGRSTARHSVASGSGRLR